jgi:hypothetical protein
MRYIITAAAIVGFAVAIYEAREVQRAKTAINVLTQERDALARRVEDGANNSKRLLAKMGSVNKRSVNEASVPRGQVRFGSQNLDSLLEDPFYRKLQASSVRGKLDARYAALFRSLRLKPDKIIQLKNLLVERQMAQTDAIEAANSQGLGSEAVNQAQTDATASVDSEIKADLGDVGYEQYQEYEKTQSERGVVNQIQQALSYTSTPMGDEEANQLVEALRQAAFGQEYAKSTTITIASDGTMLASPPRYTVTDRSMAYAQNVLSPEQMQALQTIQEQQQAQQQITTLSGPAQIRMGPAR